jgi:hypothetical protein
MIPPPKYLPNNIPFAQALPTIVDIPPEDQGKTDLYIDDQATVIPDLGWNLPRAAAAAAFSAHIVVRPFDKDEHILCDDFIANDKLIAEARLAETMTLLGWVFNTRDLTISLPHNKHVEVHCIPICLSASGLGLA